MKKTSLALLLLAATATSAQQGPPDSLPFDMDVLIQVPKYTVSFGARSMSGVKTAFSGSGSLSTIQDHGPLTGTDEVRLYHDGAVGLDTRVDTSTDENGETVSTPITPDGRTNTWFYREASQVTPDGNIAMHTYRAQTIDAGPRSGETDSSFGVEVSVARTLPRIVARFDWNIAAGLSLNDIRSNLSTLERATVTTLTDVYSLDGVEPPEAPYSAPSFTSEEITNEDGTTTTIVHNTTVLLGNEPISRETTTTTVEGNATNNWKLNGAYYTMRAGPTIIFPFSERLRATVSAGAAFVYAGTNYTITRSFQPDTGAVITDTVTDSYSKLLPGYYADANIEFWFTERAGLYLGAIYQGSGEYTQTVRTETADYSTDVDLSRLQGFRFGMNIKF